MSVDTGPASMDTGTERCADEDCVICYPLITKTGHVVTPDELEQWAEEAAAGYEL